MQEQLYQFYPGEGGIFVEIYLPKRADFQGRLYDSLTKGFDLEKVKAHFKSEKAANIRKLLLKYYDEIANYTDETIDKMETVFWGYSMYEVDGVFYNPEKGIEEERTQVLRVMFLPNIKHLYSNFRLSDDDRINEDRIRMLVKKYLRSPSNIAAQFKAENTGMNTVELSIVDYLDVWIQNVALFLFGYIVYEICERILELYNEIDTDKDIIENEIWITSFWNLTTNRIIFEKTK